MKREVKNAILSFITIVACEMYWLSLYAVVHHNTLMFWICFGFSSVWFGLLIYANLIWKGAKE